MTEIEFDNRLYSNEIDFCRVYSSDILLRVQRILLKNRISYFVKEENTSLLSWLFGSSKESFIVRINSEDAAIADYFIHEIRGVDILENNTREDWIPSQVRAGRHALAKNG